MELLELAVLDQTLGEGMKVRQLLEHFLIGGVASLSPPDHGKLQLLEENRGQLLGRIKVKGFPRQAKDFPLEAVGLRAKLLPDRLQVRSVDPNADLLHLAQNFHKRH